MVKSEYSRARLDRKYILSPAECEPNLMTLQMSTPPHQHHQHHTGFGSHCTLNQKHLLYPKDNCARLWSFLLHITAHQSTQSLSHTQTARNSIIKQYLTFHMTHHYLFMIYAILCYWQEQYSQQCEQHATVKLVQSSNLPPLRKWYPTGDNPE